MENGICFVTYLLFYGLINPSNTEANLRPNYKDAKIFENHLNPVMLVLFGMFLLSTLR